jgi:hypothetical protein
MVPQTGYGFELPSTFAIFSKRHTFTKINSGLIFTKKDAGLTIDIFVTSKSNGDLPSGNAFKDKYCLLCLQFPNSKSG